MGDTVEIGLSTYDNPKAVLPMRLSCFPGSGLTPWVVAGDLPTCTGPKPDP